MTMRVDQKAIGIVLLTLTTIGDAGRSFLGNILSRHLKRRQVSSVLFYDCIMN
jgi:hypothetical protein